MVSKAFWGGVWGAVLAPLLQGLRGPAYWAGWILIGAFALSLVAFFVVPPIKGEPVPALWPRFLAALMVNAAWGLGTGLFLKLFRRARPRQAPDRGRWRAAKTDRPDQLDRLLGLKGSTTGQTLVGDHRERPQIGPVIDGLSKEQFFAAKWK